MTQRTMAVVTFAIVTLLFAACGGGSGPTPYPSPAPAPPAPGPQPPPAAVTWDQAKAVIEAHCAPCHNAVKEPLLEGEGVFRASQAKAELSSKGMPPAGAPPLADADRALLLAFLSQ